MTQAEFLSLLRQLVALPPETTETLTEGRHYQEYEIARENPARWLTEADPSQQEAAWRLIETRHLAANPPHPAVAGTAPLVLYFANDADRQEMIDAVRLAKPGMVEARVP